MTLRVWGKKSNIRAPVTKPSLCSRLSVTRASGCGWPGVMCDHVTRGHCVPLYCNIVRHHCQLSACLSLYSAAWSQGLPAHLADPSQITPSQTWPLAANNGEQLWWRGNSEECSAWRIINSIFWSRFPHSKSCTLRPPYICNLHS